MLACRLCHQASGILLARAKAEAISREAFGTSYEGVGSRSIMDGSICEKCEDLLKAGAIGLVPDDDKRMDSMVLSKEFAERNGIEPGKIYRIPYAQFMKIWAACEQIPDARAS